MRSRCAPDNGGAESTIAATYSAQPMSSELRRKPTTSAPGTRVTFLVQAPGSRDVSALALLRRLRTTGRGPSRTSVQSGAGPFACGLDTEAAFR